MTAERDIRLAQSRLRAAATHLRHAAHLHPLPEDVRASLLAAALHHEEFARQLDAETRASNRHMIGLRVALASGQG